MRRLVPFFALALAACAGGPTSPVDAPSVAAPTDLVTTSSDLELQDNVKILDGDLCLGDVFTDGLDRLLLVPNCPVATLGLDPGTIVVGSFDGGYLREILSAEQTAGSLILHTEPMPLSKLIKRGGFDATVEFPESRETIDLAGRTLFDGLTNGHQAELSVGVGSIDLDQKLNLSAWYDCDGEIVEGDDCGKLVRSRTEIDLSLNVDLALEASFDDGASIAGEVSLARKILPFAFSVGGLPVAGSLDVRVEARYEASADGRVYGRTGGASWEGHLILGGEWNRGEGWDLTSDRTWESQALEPVSPELSRSFDARVSLRAEAFVKLYGAFGPNVWVEPYLSGRIDASCETADWEVLAGIQAGVQLRLHLFALDLPLQHELESWDWQHELAGGSVELPVTLPGDCDDAPPVDVVPPGPPQPQPGQCHSTTPLECGGAIGSDTAQDTAWSTIDGWGINVGNYTGAEMAFEFTAPHDGSVTVGLLGARPTEVNHDVFVIDGSVAGCHEEGTIAWGSNSVSFDAVAGQTYFLVVDGYAGDAGFFMLEVECD